MPPVKVRHTVFLTNSYEESNATYDRSEYKMTITGLMGLVDRQDNANGEEQQD